MACTTARTASSGRTARPEIRMQHGAGQIEHRPQLRASWPRRAFARVRRRRGRRPETLDSESRPALRDAGHRDGRAGRTFTWVRPWWASKLIQRRLIEQPVERGNGSGSSAWCVHRSGFRGLPQQGIAASRGESPSSVISRSSARLPRSSATGSTAVSCSW